MPTQLWHNEVTSGKSGFYWNLCLGHLQTILTLGETENEWQKTEQVPIILLRGARSFFDAKKMKKKNFASLDFGDNPIYPISNPDGQDWEV